jgi:hypothetical protein
MTRVGYMYNKKKARFPFGAQGPAQTGVLDEPICAGWQPRQQSELITSAAPKRAGTCRG